MLRIIGQTSVRLTAFLVAACVAMDGISLPATPTQPGRAMVEIDDAQASLYSKSVGSYVRTPTAFGTTTYKNEKATLDISNISEGYVMVRCTGSVGEIEIQITKNDSETYAYDLNNSGVYEVFPLLEDSGPYQVKVFESIQGNQYSQVFNQNIDAGVVNQLGPLLYPSQYVNFNAAGVVVQTDVTAAAGASDQIGVVATVYDCVTDNIPHDMAKTISVQSGYPPDVDVVLTQKEGICFGYAALMMVMLRSQDILTKLVIGYAEDLYHAWINVYLEGQDWVSNIICLDRNSQKLMDPASAPSGS